MSQEQNNFVLNHSNTDSTFESLGKWQLTVIGIRMEHCFGSYVRLDLL